MSRIPHLDNQFTDGSEVASLTHRSYFAPKKIPGIFIIKHPYHCKAAKLLKGKIVDQTAI
jgi:hypothetical protein